MVDNLVDDCKPAYAAALKVFVDTGLFDEWDPSKVLTVDELSTMSGIEKELMGKCHACKRTYPFDRISLRCIIPTPVTCPIQKFICYYQQSSDSVSLPRNVTDLLARTFGAARCGHEWPG